MDWSYHLLTEPERALLRRLSVFVGGCALSAAEAVCAGQGIEPWEILDLMSRLVDKSLVVYEEQNEQGRYRLLEPVRQYARERLLESTEAEMIRERHLDFFIQLTEQIVILSCTAKEQVWWFDRLEPEQDNVRAALEWCRTSEYAAEAGLRLAGAFSWFWYMHGYFTEGTAWLEEMLAKGVGVSPSIRARALSAAGYLVYFLNEQSKAHAYLHEAIATFREIDDRWHLAIALDLLGNITLYEGDFGTTKALAQEALSLAREQGNRLFIAFSIFLLGFQAYMEADYERAMALLEESTRLWREMGNKHFFANSLIRLGDVKQCLGHYAQARAHYVESLACAGGMAFVITCIRCLVGLAGVEIAHGDAERSARLLGATHALVQAMHVSMPLFEQAVFDRIVAAVYTALGDEATQRAWNEGQSMTLEQAVQHALETDGEQWRTRDNQAKGSEKSYKGGFTTTPLTSPIMLVERNGDGDLD